MAIFGVTGACRGGEFVKIQAKDVEVQGNLIIVRIPKTKTDVPRSFAIEGELARIVKKYIELRPPTAKDRFFVHYRNGKCSTQFIGKHMFEKMPKEIAKYLNLEDSELYTGHSFRRTSATLYVDAGADLTMLKRHGAWKSSTVAEGNILIKILSLALYINLKSYTIIKRSIL